MKFLSNNVFKPYILASIMCMGVAPNISYAEPDSGISNGTREFLSDPKRVGTLTGSILGGALTAHPAGVIAGSIAGFLIGKKSMFKSEEELRLAQMKYGQRSIIPGTGISPTGKQVLSMSLSGEDVGAFGGEAPVLLTPLQKIAALCHGGGMLEGMDEVQVASVCYYHQSSG